MGAVKLKRSRGVHGIFVFVTAFACYTKYDFTSWLPYLFVGLWALILVGFVAAFHPYNSISKCIYGGLALLIFSTFILMVSQLIMRRQLIEDEIVATCIDSQRKSKNALTRV
jgi:FtsH-binding integral membrane protein